MQVEMPSFTCLTGFQHGRTAGFEIPHRYTHQNDSNETFWRLSPGAERLQGWTPQVPVGGLLVCMGDPEN